MGFLAPIAAPLIGGLASGVAGGLMGGGSRSGGTTRTSAAPSATSGTSRQTTGQTTRQALPGATPMQAYGENALMRMMQGYNPQGQMGLAGQSTGAMSNLFGGGAPQVSPQQQAMIQGQTKNFMQGLQQQLEQYSKGAKSGNQQYWQKRGMPGSSMEVGGRSNIDAQMLQSLGQGYTQAKGQELQNMLQYPMQNMQYMQGMGNLQQQYNQPFMKLINQLGMSRLQGPRDVTQAGTQTGSTTGTQTGGGTTSKTGGGLQNILTGAGAGMDLFGNIAGMFGGGGGSSGQAPKLSGGGSTLSGWYDK